MQANRRSFLKNAMTAGAVSAAVAAGLLTPSVVLAGARDNEPANDTDKANGWPRPFYKNPDRQASLTEILGADYSTAVETKDISIKAPDIAENGAQVPVTVKTKLDIAKVAILVDKNEHPVICDFVLSNGATATVGTRIKMMETSDVVAVVVTTDGKVFKGHKEVKVTIGGCGG